MNPLFWPTLLLSAILFWFGQRSNRAAQPPSERAALWVISLALATPGILFALYYTKLLGDPLWLCRFRALPGTELSAAGLGFLAGLIQAAREFCPHFRKLTSRIGVPTLFAFVLCLPYLKPVLRPLRLPATPNGWFDGVCKQSTPSTCGPASAATLVRLANMKVEEYGLAHECFTSDRGTENWYLARALRKHGMQVVFVRLAPDANHLPYPAIAGVRLSHGTGHFIPILGMEGTDYIVGDPMVGREVKSLTELRDEYQFTGFFLIVK